MTSSESPNQFEGLSISEALSYILLRDPGIQTVFVGQITCLQCLQRDSYPSWSKSCIAPDLPEKPESAQLIVNLALDIYARMHIERTGRVAYAISTFDYVSADGNRTENIGE